MVSVSIRPLLMPGIAVATAGVVAIGPALVAPPVLRAAAPAVPTVHIEDIQLAGIGQEIYYALTPYVQYGVGGVSYLINFIPLIGGPIAAQININYFQGVQPFVESTVNYLAAVVQDPFNFLTATEIYGNQLYGIGYNWVSAELRFLGFPELPPLAAAAEVRTPVRSAAAISEQNQPISRDGADRVTASSAALEWVNAPVNGPLGPSSAGSSEVHHPRPDRVVEDARPAEEPLLSKRAQRETADGKSVSRTGSTGERRSVRPSRSGAW